METKLCNTCKLTKTLDLFYNNGRNKCKECVLKTGKEYTNSHRLEKSIYNKEYREKNKEKLNQESKDYYNSHKEQLDTKQKKYLQRPEVKERTRKYWSNYNKDKRKTDVQFKLRSTLRRRLGNALKKEFKSGSAIRDLGCSIDEFKLYLESNWLEGMTWDNYGNKEGQWSIDHTIPLSSFDLTIREQLLIACNYKNQLPMWHIDNLKKNKY